MPRDVQIVSVSIGDVVCAREPLELRAVLGSCIAVCLYDPATRIGGMNHVLLPGVVRGPDAGRYAESALRALLTQLLDHGAARSRLQAKAFGGAHVLPVPARDNDVAARNAEAIRAFLAAASIPLVAEDLGGRTARQVRFHSWDGRAFVRRISPAGARQDP